LPSDAPAVTYAVNGVAQKGPFANGTTVTIAECDNSLALTGRTFMTSIVDNTGAFTLPSVQLVGKYMSLTADGFYFDEVANQLSASRIALTALADATDRRTVNVNLLTHLEQPRITYLLGQGIAFASAKLQAQREVLAVFGFAISDAAPSESLDIARGTEDDAILLAVSAILQGRRTPAELTELLSNIATDLRTDGVLNSTASGSMLMNAAVLLNLPAIRGNLVQRYDLMGVTAKLGDFEKYVQAFIASAKYPFTDNISYPATGSYGVNVLDPAVASYGAGDTMSLLATLPRGTSLKVHLSGQGGAMWAYTLGKTSCWTITTFDSSRQTQDYSVTSGTVAQTCDLQLSLLSLFSMSPNPVDVGSGKPCIQMDYYENPDLWGSATPTRTKLVCQNAGVGGQPDAGAIASPPDAGTPIVDAATEPPRATSDAQTSSVPDAGAAGEPGIDAHQDLASSSTPDGGSGCLEGRLLCGGICTDVTNNLMNCGACGNFCSGGGTCSMGQCICPSMPPGSELTRCGNGCLNLKSDAANCGACGNACTPGWQCVSGQCTACSGGSLSVCNGTCTDLSTNPMNCGACGNFCSGGGMCSGGQCVCPTMPPGNELTRCGNGCTNLKLDTANCGVCGQACPAPQICSNGACTL
jgi:hypothetical protein